MQETIVSVICPLYYGQKYIDSILEMLKENQKRLEQSGITAGIELVFVNDAPDQKISLPKHWEGISVKLIEHEQNRGIHQSRVTALEQARGMYLLFLDQDDKICDDYLVNQLSHIGQNDAVLCNGYYQNHRVIYSSMERQKKAAQFMDYLHQKYVIVSPGQVLLKRDAVPEEWKRDCLKKNGSDDVLLWILMLSKSKEFAVNGEKLYWHIESGENASYHFENMRASIIEMKQRVLMLDCLSNEEKEIFRAATEERLARYEQYISLQSKIERLHQEACLDSLRRSVGSQRVAVYGWGILGREIYRRLRKASISVCYAIDSGKDAFMEPEIPLYLPGEDFPEADVIIVTPVTGFREIKAGLEKKSSAKVISLQEFLDIPDTISVIIPVYNTAAYLEKCLDSVCGQNYRSLEIICVDDGSTDGSEKIVDEYAKRDSRVKVIHKPNGGESSARNTGLRYSTGKYITFVDCDDWIEPEMYEKMLDAMHKKDVELVACNYFWDTDRQSHPMQNQYPVSREVFGRKELFQYVYIRDRYRGVTALVWCKLFQRKLLYENGKLLEFPEDLRFGADNVFFLHAAANAKRICYLEDAFYHYYQRGTSTSHTEDLEVAYDIVITYQRMIDYLRERELERQMIPWLQRFKVYRASLVAEQAFAQGDRNLLRKCQQDMRELESIYFETNWDYPERLERYKRIMNYCVEDL